MRPIGATQAGSDAFLLSSGTINAIKTERGGFEPPNEVNPRYAISSRARSTAPAPLHGSVVSVSRGAWAILLRGVRGHPGVPRATTPPSHLPNPAPQQRHLGTVSANSGDGHLI